MTTMEKIHSRKGGAEANHSRGEIGSNGDADSYDSGSDTKDERRVDTQWQHQMKPVTWYNFLDGHKECDHKCMRVCKTNIVPVPIGPSIPRRDQPEVFNQYC